MNSSRKIVIIELYFTSLLIQYCINIPGMYTVIIKSYGKGKYNSYSVNRVHFLKKGLQYYNRIGKPNYDVRILYK